MASSHTNENSILCKTCRCGEGDTNIWTTRASDNTDKQLQKCSTCQVYKSGPLFLSSKGIGWTSWKKRWFILTRTSLVFYRSDPNTTPQKGTEANLTLGGIDLNSSGSIVVKVDKKLLTVHFPDVRDDRSFTLKAETSEDLYEWKTALENALAQAPSAAVAVGQNGIFHNDIADSVEASFEQWRDRRPVKSLVVGRPILLALEDIDGSPSFLEKALRFIEEHGIKVEGILRQSADVEEVERRVHEYEQGRNEFSRDEDAHVVGDCIKHILRELASSPVPASCCTALVEAYRTDRRSRINAMHAAIAETFPMPNRRLVQRILKMMRTVASHKFENRMTLSALAACMAPLLLRPLLAGDCELEDDFNMGGDGSIQLLQAAAAANHAQAIVIILLEEYEKIFDEDLLEDGSFSSELYSELEDGDVEDGELTDNDILEEDGYHDADDGLEADIDDYPECSSSGTLDNSNSEDDSDSYYNKVSENHNADSSSPKDDKVVEVSKTPSKTSETPELHQTPTDIPFPQHQTPTDIPFPQHPGVQKDGISQSENSNSSVQFSRKSHECISNAHTFRSSMLKSVSRTLPSSIAKRTDKSNEPLSSIKQPTVWGRTSARRNLSMESIDFSSEDEIAIQRLEMTKRDLQTKVTKEVQGNAYLQASFVKRTEGLHERRLGLEQDVERLREQLQKERDLRASLESGLMNLRPRNLPITSSIDSKTRADLEEIALAEADIISLKQKVADLRGQLSHRLQHSYASLCESCSQHLYARHQSAEKDQQIDVDSTTLVLQNEHSPKTENACIQADHEDISTQTPDSPSSRDTQTLPKQHRNTTDQSITSGDENSMPGTDCENVKTQTQDSPSSPNKQPPQKLPLNMTNQCGTKPRGPNCVSSTEEPTTVGRISDLKKSSLPTTQPLQKQQPNTRSSWSGDGSSEETTTVSRKAASKKSTTKGEETASSSSTLTKLTNRLNFLKERRVQLVNELQNLDSSPPDGPPPGTNPR